MGTMNKKNLGEIGERIAIGELAKYGIDVMLPMSDNLPFDLVVYYNNKFFKCQVKTSTTCVNGSMVFSIVSNDWYKKTKHYYNNDEVDVFILCDLNTIYLVKFGEIPCKNAINLRKIPTRSGQVKGTHFASDYAISEKRISEVFI